MDTMDKQTRSRVMSRIRGRDTKPEMVLRKSLHKLGFRYRLHVRSLPGKPDIVLPKYCAAILVHGCFWHRHPNCSLATTPSSNVSFWQQKFRNTIARDAKVLRELQNLEWRVATVWQCALGKNVLAQTTASLGNWIKSDAVQLEIPQRKSTVRCAG